MAGSPQISGHYGGKPTCAADVTVWPLCGGHGGLERAACGLQELKKNGAFLLPGFAKFVVIKKPATKERAGINPFTKEPTVFKAKPARKIVRARPVKAAKDAV